MDHYCVSFCHLTIRFPRVCVRVCMCAYVGVRVGRGWGFGWGWPVFSSSHVLELFIFCTRSVSFVYMGVCGVSVFASDNVSVCVPVVCNV